MNKESRQLLNFLKKQNKMLKDDIKQLNQILKLNKEALQVSLMYKNQQNYEKSIPHLIKLLYEQNNKLHAKNNQLKAEIQTGMCQALISQQIAFASTAHEVLLTNELKDRLVKLKKQLQNRQNKIIQLSKVNLDEKNQTNTQTNANPVAMKMIEYVDMNKVTKRLKDSMQKLNQQLDSKKQQIQKLRDAKEQLFKLNLILTKQMNEMRFVSSCQTTKSNNQISVQMSNNDMSKYLKYQKRLVNEEENIYEGQSMGSGSGSSSQYSGSEESQVDEFPSQEEYNQNQKQQQTQKQQDRQNKSLHSMTLNMNKIKLNSNLKPKLVNMSLNLGNLGLKKNTLTSSKGQEKLPKMNIPKLQLSRAKQIQNLIVKKINNDQKKKKESNNLGVKEQKYKKLQDDLENLRKKMGDQILQKLAFQRECNFMKKIISELEERNVILVQHKIQERDEENYQKNRKNNQQQNTQSLLDICRDVTLNQRLRKVVLGKEYLPRKNNIECLEI